MPNQEVEAGPVAFEDAGLQRGFTMAPNVILDSGLGMAARMCYIALASFAWGDKAECFPGNESLARRMGCNSRTVIRAKQELVEAGLLKVTRRGLNRTNVYTLVLKQAGSDESSLQEATSSQANKTSDKKRRISDGDPTDLSSDSVPNLEKTVNTSTTDPLQGEQMLAEAASRMGVDGAAALLRSYAERFPERLALASREFQHAYDCDNVRDPAAYVAAFLRNGPDRPPGERRFDSHRRDVVRDARGARAKARERGLSPPRSPQAKGTTRWWKIPEEESP